MPVMIILFARRSRPAISIAVDSPNSTDFIIKPIEVYDIAFIILKLYIETHITILYSQVLSP